MFQCCSIAELIAGVVLKLICFWYAPNREPIALQEGCVFAVDGHGFHAAGLSLFLGCLNVELAA